MDPEACLIAILRAIQCRDTEEARERLEDLCGWVIAGGFIPRGIEEAIKALTM